MRSLALGAVLASAVFVVGSDAARAEASDRNGPELAQTATDVDAVGDPLEPLNRVFFNVNEFLQALILRPLSEMYVMFIPSPVRTAVGNAIDNLRAPVVLANDLLQAKPDRAMNTLGRFVVNSTLGIAGTMDRATEMGLKAHEEDFGQTLGYWGVGEGFYLVLPLFGPSNPRDAVGRLYVDNFFDPLGLYLNNTNQDEAIWARTGVNAVDSYSGVMDDLDQVKRTSVDYYAAIRSLYRQKRAAEIRDGDPDTKAPIPDIRYDID